MKASTEDLSTSGEVGEGSIEARRWLLLTHHLPPEPAYFRVKVRRRLERIGAVALKNSVYVLPNTGDALEDFHWLFQEIEREGGVAALAEASFVDGATDARVIERFQEARDADYAEVAASARHLVDEVERGGSAEHGAAGVEARLERLVKRLEEVVGVDFFGARGRAAAAHAVRQARAAFAGEGEEKGSGAPLRPDVGTGRTWVTRADVRVDRIASAWLIRRFIDPDARFRFAPARGYSPTDGELRFDMFEGEFTHVGDSCTFETLLARFDLDDPALTAMAELVHDIDCKDDKFGRPELAGVASVIDGVVRKHQDDGVRLDRGAELLDELHAHFASLTGLTGLADP
ncbi:MAG TPA: chromate resistance protein ChrB domain-containing protein [Longimicrobiales bacterium]|jgi:hypothetical protein